MRLLLERNDFTNKSTIGLLFIDTIFECYILEDVDRKLEAGGEKIAKKTAIPRGEYKIVINYSNRFKRLMPHILDVPQFIGIRIHAGNDDADTDGCLLTGKDKGIDVVYRSRDAFDVLFEKLADAFMREENITIQII